MCLCCHFVSFVLLSKSIKLVSDFFITPASEKLPIGTLYVLYVTLLFYTELFHIPSLLYFSMIFVNFSELVNQIFTLWCIPIQHICDSVLHFFVLWNILNTFTNPYTFRWTIIFSWKGSKLFRPAYFVPYQDSPRYLISILSEIPLFFPDSFGVLNLAYHSSKIMNYRFKSTFFSFIKHIKETIILGFIAFSDIIHTKMKA